MARLTQEEYISKCVGVHGDRYDYSETVYRTAHEPLEVICKIHGKFKLLAYSHLGAAQGCSVCKKEEMADEAASAYVDRVNTLHGGKITVTKDSCVGKKQSDRIQANCKEHGVFTIGKATLNTLGGCPSCDLQKRWLRFLDKAAEVHKGKYTYSRAEYNTGRKLMSILCNSCNSTFEQRPAAHLQGHSCPSCSDNTGPRLTKEQLISKCVKVIGDHHDYSMVNTALTSVPQTVTCKKHGTFNVVPSQPTDCSGCVFDNRATAEVEKIKAYCESHSPNITIFYDKLIYKGSRSLITLTCSRHGDWSSSPNKLMKPDRSMCCPSCIKELATIGRWHPKVVKRDPAKYKSIKQDLYLLSTSVGDEEIIKVGVTRNKSSRFSQIRSESGQDWQEVTSTVGYNMYSSVMAESFLKKKLKDFKYSSPVWFGGHTELFKVDNETKDWLVSFINTLDHIGGCDAL